MSSAEVARTLESARQELQLKRNVLLEKKGVLIEEVRRLLPGKIDNAIYDVVERNADRIEELTPEELRKTKSAIEAEKTKAVERGVSALQSAPEWLGGDQESIDGLGVIEEGAIWRSLQNYSKDMRAIFESYGLTVDQQLPGKYSMSPFTLHMPRSYGEKQRLQEISELVGTAHRNYCDSMDKVASLEQRVKGRKAREKYESV